MKYIYIKMIKLLPEYLIHSVSRSSKIIFVRHVRGFSDTVDLEILDISILYVCFVDRCFSFCNISFGHCVVCPSSIYGFWLPLCYLQTLLITNWQLIEKPRPYHNWGGYRGVNPHSIKLGIVDFWINSKIMGLVEILSFG